MHRLVLITSILISLCREELYRVQREFLGTIGHQHLQARRYVLARPNDMVALAVPASRTHATAI